MRRGPLIPQTSRPFNGETPLKLLIGDRVQTADTFFVRDHGEMYEVDLDTFRLSVHGDRNLSLSLGDLASLPRLHKTATIMCAGARRVDASRDRGREFTGEVRWGGGAIGTANWSGFRLRDVLAAAGVAAGTHVAFVGHDQCRVPGGVTPFTRSIPLEAAMRPDVLLVDRMNGRPLTRAHGAPLRLLVPGWVGAAQVKSVAEIWIQPGPSTNHFQVNAYRGHDGESLTHLPINSEICTPSDDDAVIGPRVDIAGYAITGGDRVVDGVDVSSDDGRSWISADFIDPPRPESGAAGRPG